MNQVTERELHCFTLLHMQRTSASYRSDFLEVQYSGFFVFKKKKLKYIWSLHLECDVPFLEAAEPFVPEFKDQEW